MKTTNQLTRWTIIVCLMLMTLRAQAFYNTSSGRWLTRDPIGEEGGNNLFAFVGNNPANAIDPMGQFWTFGHNRMIDNAFGNSLDFNHYLAGWDRDMLKAGSKYIDSSQFQKPEFSYMHGMAPKAKPGENQADVDDRAVKQGDQFILDQFWCAVDSGSRNGALFELGMGMHTIMDRASPEHAFSDGSPRPWRGFNSWAGLGDAAGHGLKEFFHSIPSFIDNLTGTTDQLKSYYDYYELLSN